MDNLNFAKQLIKGRIAETIFEQMMKESGKYTVIPFGYEQTVPQLAQYQDKVELKTVLENIRHAPDFILISEDKTEVYLVEVKYRKHIDKTEIKEIAEHTLKIWNPSYLFVASLDGFFFEPCNTIVNNDGDIGRLYPKWADDETRKKYLELLKEFELQGI
jgi:hypothetical protein